MKCTKLCNYARSAYKCLVCHPELYFRKGNNGGVGDGNVSSSCGDIFSLKFDRDMVAGAAAGIFQIKFKMYSTDLNDILHTSRQLHCCDVCRISL